MASNSCRREPVAAPVASAAAARRFPSCEPRHALCENDRLLERFATRAYQVSRPTLAFQSPRPPFSLMPVAAADLAVARASLPPLRNSSSSLLPTRKLVPWHSSGVRDGVPLMSRSSERLEQLAPGLGGPTLLMPVPDLPTLESVALRAISEREYHLSRLHALLLSAIGPVPVDPVDLPAYATLLSTVRSASAQELQALRLASVDVVEAIVRWRRRRRRPFEPFVWRSHNYLLKMLLDVFFLGLASTVDDAAADPFLLRSFAEALEHGRRMEADTAALLNEQTEAARVIQARYHEKAEKTGLGVDVASPASHSVAATSCAPSSGGSAAPGARAAYARRKYLCSSFTPERRHTKQEMVRMWAAERVLEAERTHLGAAFEPISPVLRPTDVEVRRMADLIWFGVGEPPELVALDASMPRHPRPKARDPDPCLKPPRPPVGRAASRSASTALQGTSPMLKPITPGGRS